MTDCGKFEILCAYDIQEDVITEIERIITKIEEVEIERMPVDTNKSRHQTSKKRRSNSCSFYWWYARLLKFNDSFKIPIDINNAKDSNLLLQKRVRDRDAKKAIIGIN